MTRRHFACYNRLNEIKMSQPSPKSLQGRLLLAARELIEPTFARSIILIVQHDDHGAMGLMLNRPLDVSVKEAVERASEIECVVEDVVFQGGPCEGPAMLLHSSFAHSQIEPVPGVHFTANSADVEELLRHPSQNLRCFAGYAGWTGGQLENELLDGAWTVVTDVTASQIFARPEPKQWMDLTGRATLRRWIDPKRIPDDPTLN